MQEKEPLIVLVGFLGAGKTTLLKRLVDESLTAKQDPFVVINDYQSAAFDAQQFIEKLGPELVSTLNGSCICCSGISELRSSVNGIPERTDGVTFIEANGTSDACTLMEFLGVGINDRFAPPVQISVVSAKDWQRRGMNNELEANQVQVSSLILLTHLEKVDYFRVQQVKNEICELNPKTSIKKIDDFGYQDLFTLKQSENSPEKMDHKKAHWASCSIDLPETYSSQKLRELMEKIPESVLRVKGCTRFDGDEHYSYFERLPNQEVCFRKSSRRPFTGPKLITVGPGSDPEALRSLI